MAIYIDSDTRLIVQGITGKAGAFHAEQMIAYGTKVVGGVTPERGGETFMHRVPIFGNRSWQAIKKPAQMLRSSMCPRHLPLTQF